MTSKQKELIEKGEDSRPCTSRQANEILSQSNVKRSLEDLVSDQEANSRSSKKTRKSNEASTDLANASRFTISKLLWGVLNFYSNKKLIYTHYLWDNEPVSISADSLQNVRTFNLGREQIESLADDFRYVLGIFRVFVLLKISNK